MMNIQRQLKVSMSAVSKGGAIIGPSVEVQLKMPVGRPRARTFHQSFTTRALDENIGPSPSPRQIRARTNWEKLPTSPPATWATDQTSKPTESSLRGP